MIRQARIGVKVEETDAAVTGLGGVPVLVNGADEMRLFDEEEAVLHTLTAMREEDWVPIQVEPDPDDPERYVREWACESVHTLNQSKRSYRILFLRKERRQGELFEGSYPYAAIITNRNGLPRQELIAGHRQPCNAEHHMKELKI